MHKSFVWGVVTSSCLVLAAPMASAQVLDEVVVTAQKREQNIQDVGIAISAFSGDQISQLGWSNAEQVAAQTPGLIATSYNNAGTISLFSIRGVAQTDFNDHQEAPTVVYLDGAYLPQTSGGRRGHVRHGACRSPQGPAGNAVRSQRHRRARAPDHGAPHGGQVRLS